MIAMSGGEHHHANHTNHVVTGDHTSGHEEHGEDSRAKPCCSACGPTLPAEPVLFASLSAPQILPEPEPIRALATRPPFPAYEATGPPRNV